MKKEIIIVVGITILFLGTCITPTVAIDNVKKTSTTIGSGNILYVGGTGPNNYTKIQDAIDDAVDGDTVFVYDDCSPYYENLVVNKSINLFGEDKYSTIINGSITADVIEITSDWVNLSGFLIINGINGIQILSNHNAIENNIIINNRFYGIDIVYTCYNVI